MRILRDYKRPNQNIDWYADIMEVTAKDIIERFGRPDVIWASPPCPKCNGTGMCQIAPGVRGIKVCPVCKGKKMITDNKDVRGR